MSPCKGCTLARTKLAEPPHSSFHPDLEILGYSPHVSWDVRRIVRALETLIEDRGKTELWKSNRDVRHYLIMFALAQQAHNIACYTGIMSGFSRQSRHPLVLAFPQACGDWIDQPSEAIAV